MSAAAGEFGNDFVTISPAAFPVRAPARDSPGRPNYETKALLSILMGKGLGALGPTGEVRFGAMDIISLDLNRPGENKGAALSELPETPVSRDELIERLRILMRGIALHAVDSDATELANFRHGMGQIADSVGGDSSPDDLLRAIVEALRLTEHYKRQATVILKSQVEELRGMLQSLTETMQFVLSSSETSVKQLAFMESQLQRAHSLDDLRRLKTHVLSCLTLVKRESIRIQTEAAERVETLKKNVAHLSVRLKEAAVDKSLDAATGLPAREAGEQALEGKLAEGKDFAIALFFLDQIESINGSFGRSIGDEMVLRCAQILAKGLHGATLYRWNGPGFLAIFDSSVASLEAESLARRASAEQVVKNIDEGERMGMIVSHVSCHVQRILPQTMTPAEIFKRIDAVDPAIEPPLPEQLK